MTDLEFMNEVEVKRNIFHKKQSKWLKLTVIGFILTIITGFTSLKLSLHYFHIDPDNFAQFMKALLICMTSSFIPLFYVPYHMLIFKTIIKTHKLRRQWAKELQKNEVPTLYRLYLIKTLYKIQTNSNSRFFNLNQYATNTFINSLLKEKESFIPKINEENINQFLLDLQLENDYFNEFLIEVKKYQKIDNENLNKILTKVLSTAFDNKMNNIIQETVNETEKELFKNTNTMSLNGQSNI